MGSKERMAREKEELKKKILDASLEIIITEGCEALSMRKIADRIEYAAPTLYEYFKNKDQIMTELTGRGYTILSDEIRKALEKKGDAETRLRAMWTAYWRFGFKHTELYRLMYGVKVSCPKPKGTVANIDQPQEMFTRVIGELLPDSQPVKGEAERWYYALWSLVHGLIAINLANVELSDKMNRQILEDAIGGLIKSFRH